MGLVSDYLRVLRPFLPNHQRDDIIKELTASFESQVAEQEEEFGRPLTVAEEAALIAPYGHPLLMSARYRPQRYVVGPILSRTTGLCSRLSCRS